ncbi:hypothetical protein AB0M02_26950 [Actinoplanes sp. NPDC051861]|uniref:hypothetical protein n=1 Tax=Actinoplanes sp. NPDC051861 TaxID=3155170 RepID=UPI003446FD1E
MEAEHAAEDNSKSGRADADPPEPSWNRWRILETGLQLASLYFAYKNDEAATFAVTAIIQITQLFRR